MTLLCYTIITMTLLYYTINGLLRMTQARQLMATPLIQNVITIVILLPFDIYHHE